MKDIAKNEKTLVVVGGGAAGFFCAVTAARLNPALKVTLVEKTTKLLAKVRISGGGRCNVTHACFDIADMSKRYPRGNHFVKKAFHQFFTTDTINWFEERGVKLKTEKDGRMFPVTDNSQTIIDCLQKEAQKYGVEIVMNTEVHELPKADYVCIATGGYPKTTMFNWLMKLGHTIEEPVPSLFTFNMPGHPITALMGVSVENAIVKIKDSKLSAEGPVLITHWGLSGPAVLRLSAMGARALKVMNYEFLVIVNFLPSFNEETLRAKLNDMRRELAPQKIENRNPFGLPARLWEFLVTHSGIKAGTRWADLPSEGQRHLIRNLVSFEAAVKGKTTFKEEFVTAGGIKLSEVDPNTMMSRKIPNLFFAGEVLDVDGITGGFNFQHAWTSGFIAGKSIAYL